MAEPSPPTHASKVAPVFSDPALDPDVRPGWATSEFWVTVGTVVANLLGVLALVLRLPPDALARLDTSLSAVVGAVGIIAVNGFVIWKYLHSRQEVKTSFVRAAGNLAVAREVAFGNAALMKAGAYDPAGVMPPLTPRTPV